MYDGSAYRLDQDEHINGYANAVMRIRQATRWSDGKVPEKKDYSRQDDAQDLKRDVDSER